jgi:hypothetical protein
MWKKVVYLGGVPGIRVDIRDREQTLILTATKLIIRVGPPPTTDPSERKKEPRLLVEISRESLLALTYKGFRHDMPKPRHGSESRANGRKRPTT